MEFQAPSVVLLEAAKSSSARETLRVTFKSASPWNKYLTAYGVSRSKCAKRHHKWTNSFGCYFDLYWCILCLQNLRRQREERKITKRVFVELSCAYLGENLDGQLVQARDNRDNLELPCIFIIKTRASSISHTNMIFYYLLQIISIIHSICLYE